MVPSLLPAFSAPTAVSVVPSCLASSADTAAHDAGALRDMSAATMIVLRNICCSSLECGLECQRDPAAVRKRGKGTVSRVQSAVAADRVCTEIAVVRKLHVVFLIKVGSDPGTPVAGALVASQQHGGVSAK